MGTPDQLLARVAKARAQVERARQRRTAGKAGHADVCAAEARLAKALDAARAGGAIVDRPRLAASELLGSGRADRGVGPATITGTLR